MLQEPPVPTQTPTQLAFAGFGGFQFLSLTTFQRDGQPTTTTVRFAQDGDKLYVVCPITAEMVARIHDNAQVEVAPCDARGIAVGHSVEAMAVVLSPARAAAARRAFGTPGLPQRIGEWLRARLGLPMVCLEITPM